MTKAPERVEESEGVAGQSIDEAFLRALSGEDELGVVVRAHIHLEAKLLEFLHTSANPRELARMNLDYGQRVYLALALGLKQEFGPGLHALGALRNAFAHRLDTKLSDDKVKSLYAALSGDTKKIVQHSYEVAKTKLSRRELRTFSKLPPKDRFILIVVTLQLLLQVAVERRRREPSA